MKTSETNREITINWASGINLVAGIWLFISTWALNSQVGLARINDCIFGIIIVVLAWIRLAARSRAGVASWLNLVAGIWLILAPFVLFYETAAQRWNSIVVGVVVTVLAIVSGTAGRTHHHPSVTA